MAQLPEKPTPAALDLFKHPQDPEKLKATLNRGPTRTFLEFILLRTHNSGVVRDQSTPIKAGDFTMGPSNHILGPTFVAVVGPWRPHARYSVNKAVQQESFDAESPEFEAIVQKELELYATPQKGHLAYSGVDLLLWVPARERFGSYFLTGTAKDEVGDKLPGLQGHVVMVGTHEVVTNVNSWHVPTFEVLETPPGDLALPRAEDLERALRMFAKGLTPKADAKPGPEPTRPR